MGSKWRNPSSDSPLVLTKIRTNPLLPQKISKRYHTRPPHSPGLAAIAAEGDTRNTSPATHRNPHTGRQVMERQTTGRGTSKALGDVQLKASFANKKTKTSRGHHLPTSHTHKALETQSVLAVAAAWDGGMLFPEPLPQQPWRAEWGWWL